MQLHLIKNNSWYKTPWQGNPGKKPLSPPPQLTIKKPCRAASLPLHKIENSQLNSYPATDLPEKFANLLMKNGGKLKAYNILYTALKILYIKTLNVLNSTHKQGLVLSMYVYKKILSDCFAANKNHTQMRKDRFRKKQLLFKAINNVKPSVEVRNVRVAGRIHQVPSVISQKRQQALAIRSIIQAASYRKKNSNLDFSECLATELFEALNNSGKIKQKRDALHKTAELNRASIRFKWW